MLNPNFKSKTAERSNQYSAYKMWNKLPKNWDFSKLTNSNKLLMVRKFILDNRKQIFVY